MIPSSLQARQAMAVQAAMQRNGPQADPLMQALTRQQMMGDMLKQTASHKMKMLKLRMKYGNALQEPSAPPMGSGMNGPQGQTYY